MEENNATDNFVSNITTIPIVAFIKILCYLPARYTATVIRPAKHHEEDVASSNCFVIFGPMFRVCSLWRAMALDNEEFWEALCHDRAPFIPLDVTFRYNVATFHAMFGIKSFFKVFSEGLDAQVEFSAAYVSIKCADNDRGERMSVGKPRQKAVFVSEPIVHTEGITLRAHGKGISFANIVIGVTIEHDPNMVFNRSILFSPASEMLSSGYKLDSYKKLHLTIDTSQKLFALVDDTFHVIRCLPYHRICHEGYPIRFMLCVCDPIAFKVSGYLHPVMLDPPAALVPTFFAHKKKPQSPDADDNSP
eukprot:PhF_6_TR36518/c0_g1_i2/m.53795